MTSYSIYRPETDDPEEVAEARLETFIAGAARGLLDTAEWQDGEEHPNETPEAEAVWWHAEWRGWEVEAIHPDDRERFRKRLEVFFRANYDNLTLGVAQIEADAKRFRHAYVSCEDTAWYRAGELFIYDSQGHGIGFSDHGDAGKRLSQAVGYYPVRAVAFDDEVFPGRGRYVEIEEI